MSLETQPNIMNNFAPSPTYGDKGDEIERIEMAAAPPAPTGAEQYAMDDPEKYQDIVFNEGGMAIQTFSDWICGIVNGDVRACSNLRKNYDLEARWAAEDEKFLFQQTPDIKSDGTANPNGASAHLKAGVTAGLFYEHVTTIGPAVVQSVLGAEGVPVAIKPKGIMHEMEQKRDVFTRMVEDEAEMADWRSEIRSAIIGDFSLHGFCTVRQQYVEEVCLAQDEGRNWREEVTYKGVRYRAWPGMNVYFNNPGSWRAKDQTILIWESWHPLSAIMSHRMTWETGGRITMMPDGSVQMIPLVRKAGRFVGIERLIRDYAATRATSAEEHLRRNPEGLNDERNAPTTVDYSVPYRVLERQRMFPMGTAVREKLLTPAVMAAYTINITGPDGQPLQGEALARVCDRIEWNVTIIEGGNGGAYCIECTPSPYPKGQIELLLAQLFPDGTAYGSSGNRVARDLAYAADKVLNDIIETCDYNAFGPTVVATGKAEDPSHLSEIVHGARKFTEINVPPGERISDLVEVMQRPHDAIALNLFSLLVNMHGTRTLSTEVAKGGQATTQTNTHAEVTDQLAGMNLRINELVINRVGQDQLVRPSIEFMIACMDTFNTDDELEAKATKAAGQIGLDAKYIFPTAEDGSQGRRRNLAKDFFVVWDGRLAQRKSETAQTLVEVVKLASAMLPPAALIEILKDIVRAGGGSPEKYFSETQEPLDPEQMIRAIIDYGDMPEVPKEPKDLALFIQMEPEISAMLAQTKQQAEAQGHSTDKIDSVVFQYTELVKRANKEWEKLLAELASMVQQEQQMAAQQAAESGASNGKSGGANKAQNGGGQPPGAQPAAMVG